MDGIKYEIGHGRPLRCALGREDLHDAVAAAGAMSRWAIRSGRRCVLLGMRTVPIPGAGGPAMLGHYRLDGELGRGGMGEVYRAYDTRRGRTVALKLLAVELTGERGVEARFRRECRLAAGLTSPHVVPIHDYGEIAGRMFIDMRLVDGEHLGSVIGAAGRLEPARAVDFVAQLADAIDDAHRAGIVHRDVKPSNALVTRQRGGDFVYLADFGIARVTDSVRTRITGTGVALGTAQYMAPEAFVGSAVDPAADVYALGCVLFEMLTGRVPFEGDLRQQMHQHLHSVPPRPSGHGHGIPARFDRVVATAMAKDPAQRYRSAGDLAEDARRALRAGTSNGTVGTGPRSLFAPGPGDLDIAILHLLMHDRPVRAVAYSPDGGLVATGGDDGTARLWDAETGAKLHRLVHGGVKVRRVLFSPDGTRLATAANDRSARVWDVVTGGLLARIVHNNKIGMWGSLNQAAEPYPHIVFSPEGTRLATCGYDYTARVCDATTGAELARVTHGAPVIAVAFSSDGTRVTSVGQDRVVRVWDAGTSREVARLPYTGWVAAMAHSPDGVMMAIACGDKNIRLWDTGTHRQLLAIVHDDSLHSVTFSPDGTQLGVDAWRSSHVFDVTSGIELAKRVHTVTGGGQIAFSPDGRHVVSERYQHATVWNVNDAEQNRSFYQSKGRGFSFHPDGTRAAAASDNSAIIYFRPRL